eukprot:990470-Rhodomonas_salina.4
MPFSTTRILGRRRQGSGHSVPVPSWFRQWGWLGPAKRGRDVSGRGRDEHVRLSNQPQAAECRPQTASERSEPTMEWSWRTMPAHSPRTSAFPASAMSSCPPSSCRRREKSSSHASRCTHPRPTSALFPTRPRPRRQPLARENPSSLCAQRSHLDVHDLLGEALEREEVAVLLPHAQPRHLLRQEPEPLRRRRLRQRCRSNGQRLHVRGCARGGGWKWHS